MPAKRSPKLPATQQTTSSPGETRFATADSSPPEPEELRRIRSFSVSKTRLVPLRMSLRTAANSGPRWSIIGLLAARTTRSGSGAGPGMRSCCWKIMCYLLGRMVGGDEGEASLAPTDVGGDEGEASLAPTGVGGDEGEARLGPTDVGGGEARLTPAGAREAAARHGPLPGAVRGVGEE